MSEQRKADRPATDGLSTVNEIAETYRMNPATIRLWIRSGKLPAVRVGERKYLVRDADVLAYLGDTATPRAPVSAAVAGGAKAFRVSPTLIPE